MSDGKLLPAPSLPPGTPRLVVTGFMGTGKTSAGRLAAGRLGLPFFDLDRAIEREAGMGTAAIFGRLGERSFRALERKAVAAAARLSRCVVATGGGAVLDATSFSALAADAVVAVLACEEEEILRRVRSGRGRPLLEADLAGRIRTLTRERAEAYAAAGEILDTTGRSPEEVAGELVERYERAVRSRPLRILVHGAERSYEAVLGRGVMESLGAEVAGALPAARRVEVVSDAAVQAGPAAMAAASLDGAGLRVGGPIALPAGEGAKSASVLAGLWSRLVSERLERTDAIVSVGGGATLDVAGFAAATYGRGIPHVNVPTTLLAMADAALGGKVAIDHEGVKNAVGAFHDPALVLIDPDVLSSLPAADVRAGLAEAAKAMVLAAPLGLAALDGEPDSRTIDWVIEQALRIKAAYVSADPRDLLLRHSLNLGHTFAHGLESATGYRLPHGEAVAIGLVAAARLGASAGVTDPALAGRLAELLSRLGLPIEPSANVDRQPVLAAMRGDKKRRSGRPAFVVPAESGAALIEGVADEVVEAALWAGS